MRVDEKTNLIEKIQSSGLSTSFAIICILDVFGVFPVITLPKAIIDCGYYGFFVVLLVCSTQIYTASILGKCWIIAEEIFPSIKMKNRYPYTALTEITFGKKAAGCVTVLLDICVFGAGIPNLIVASQNLQFLGQRISNGQVDISYCFWIIVVGTFLCPILWLGSPKDMKCLCSISVVIVTSVFFLLCGCILFNPYKPTMQESTLETNNSFPWRIMLKAYGILSFQFDIHPNILTIQVDMKNKSQLTKALIGGFSVTLMMFGFITLLAYLKLGILEQPSILEVLQTTIPLHLTATLVAIQLCLTSAVSNSALYQQMEDCMSISRDFNSKRCVLRTILTILAIVIAESVPKFDLVMSIIGGTLIGPLVFVLPPLIYLKMKTMRKIYIEQLALASFTNVVNTRHFKTPEASSYMKEKIEAFLYPSGIMSSKCTLFFKNYIETSLCICIIVVSAVLSLLTTYFNFISAVYSYKDITKPCIYNVSKSIIYF